MEGVVGCLGLGGEGRARVAGFGWMRRGMLLGVFWDMILGVGRQTECVLKKKQMYVYE